MAHVISSVGWIGAIAGFLPLSIAVLTSQDPQAVRSAYLAMTMIGRFVLVPAAFAALVTGLVMSLGTKWGLLRQYWVLIKFLITVIATLVLLKYMQSLTLHASTAAATTATDDFRPLRNPTHVLHATLALVALLVNTALSIFKPRGLTPYGSRRVVGARMRSAGDGPAPADEEESMGGMPRWVMVFGIVGFGLLVLFVLRLLVGHAGHGAGHTL